MGTPEGTPVQSITVIQYKEGRVNVLWGCTIANRFIGPDVDVTASSKTFRSGPVEQCPDCGVHCMRVLDGEGNYHLLTPSGPVRVAEVGASVGDETFAVLLPHAESDHIGFLAVHECNPMQHYYEACRAALEAIPRDDDGGPAEGCEAVWQTLHEALEGED